MNHNWDNYLSEGEKVELDFGTSNVYAGAILILITIVGVVLAFSNPFVGVGVFLLGLLYWVYQTRWKRYALTNRKVILIDIFLGKTVTYIKYENITDITVDQNAVDLVFNWGTVIINTAGSSLTEAVLQNVSDPHLVKTKIDNLAQANLQHK